MTAPPRHLKQSAVYFIVLSMKGESYFMRLFLLLILSMTTQSCLAEVVLQRLDGQRIPFNTLKGKWVFINYWASWCAPCLEEIPFFNRLSEENKHSVAVFAVNFDAVGHGEQQRLIQKYKLHYPSLSSDPAKALQLEDIRGVPVTFVFDPKGTLKTTLYGGQSYDNLIAVINK